MTALIVVWVIGMVVNVFACLAFLYDEYDRMTDPERLEMVRILLASPVWPVTASIYSVKGYHRLSRRVKEERADKQAALDSQHTRALELKTGIVKHEPWCTSRYSDGLCDCITGTYYRS